MMETVPLLFLITSVVIILTPGQDMVLVMSRSLTGGAAAGVITAAGISFGLLGHTLLAAVGLGALLNSSVLLFTVIKYLGAGYLVFLGVRMMRSGGKKIPTGTPNHRTPWQIFSQGMISNIANPKITLFYFAYLPQFVTPQTDSKSMQLLVLGALFAFFTFIIKAPIGYCAGKLSAWVRAHTSLLTAIYKVSGTLLIGLGLRLALATDK